jgi:hypothetical protein
VGLYPYERKCLDKFYLLAGQLYRHTLADDERPLSPCTALAPLGELCSFLGGTLLQATAVKLPLAGSSAEQGFNIEVKTLTAQTLFCTVHSDTTVKVMIEQKTGEGNGYY